MSGKTVGRMEGKTKTTVRQTKQMSATKAVKLLLINMAKK